MRILFLTHFYPPNHIGGTETYTHGLAKGLNGLGHQVQVLCAADWESGEQYWNGHTDDIYEGVPVRRLHLNWTRAPDVNRYLYDNPMIAQYLKTYLAEVQADLVHVTSCNTLSASVIGAIKEAELPVVVSLTDFWFVCPRVTLLRGDETLCDGRVTDWECLECLLQGAKAYRWTTGILPRTAAVHVLSAVSRHEEVTRLPGLRGMALDIQQRRAALHQALEQADRVLIASESARGIFQYNGFSIPIDLVHYGHDLSWLTGYAGKTASSVVRFGFIGQIAPMKGPQLLIEAYRNVSQNGKARLLVYGNLEKNPAFGQQLRSLAADRHDIEFRGIYAHSDSGKVFSEIDVLVVPSLWHDYPLIIHEAFATGTPVIASDYGGMNEFVQHEVDGLLFERGSVKDLARQLQRVIADPVLCGRLRAGIHRVKRIEEAVAEIVGIYKGLGDHREVTSNGQLGCRQAEQGTTRIMSCGS